MPYSSSLTDKEWSILLDNGYHPDTLMKELKKIYGAIDTKIQFELSPKISKEKKNLLQKTGFVPVKARWVIERTNSWMERCKSLVKNFERTLTNATTKVNLCFVRLMLKRLATSEINEREGSDSDELLAIAP